MQNSEHKRVTGIEPVRQPWEGCALRPAKTEACSAGVAKPAHCVRCGKPIEDAADEFCTPCWAAQATPAHKPGEPPLVHPDHEWSVPLTFVVAAAAIILTAFVIATWAGGVR